MPQNKDPLAIPVEQHEDHVVIRPRGYLNALTGVHIEKSCEEAVKGGVRYVIINFSQVSMVNTIGISILFAIIENVIRKNGLVYFTELGATDRQVFEALNLSTVALIFESDEAAREHLGHDLEAVRREAKT